MQLSHLVCIRSTSGHLPFNWCQVKCVLCFLWDGPRTLPPPVFFLTAAELGVLFQCYIFLFWREHCLLYSISPPKRQYYLLLITRLFFSSGAGKVSVAVWKRLMFSGLWCVHNYLQACMYLQQSIKALAAAARKMEGCPKHKIKQSEGCAKLHMSWRLLGDLLLTRNVAVADAGNEKERIVQRIPCQSSGTPLSRICVFTDVPFKAGDTSGCGEGFLN